jgi:enamine deaminase RidA (YjgF/YER057c/UK114 family)
MAQQQAIKKDFPAATWIQVVRLYMPDAKLEVELIAHLPGN